MSLEDIKSQEIALRLLKASLKEGIDTNSFLFFGPEGVGKAYTARCLIKTLNCLILEGDCCDKCKNCMRIDKGIFPDLLWVKPQSPGSSISIETVRQVRYQMSLRPYEAKKKVFVFEEAHLLSGEAQDALLKTLEEPQDNSILILITSKPHLLRETVISRCQKIRFNAIPNAVIEKVLSDEFALEWDELKFISNFSYGSLGEAKRFAGLDIFSKKNKILDSFIISSQKRTFGYDLFNLTEELKRLYRRENSGVSSDNLDFKISDIEFKDVVRIFLSFFRDAIIFKSGQSEGLINLDRIAEIERFSFAYELEELYDKINSILHLENLLSQNINEELAFLNMLEELRYPPRIEADISESKLI